MWRGSWPGADVIIQAAATTSGIRDTTLRPHIHIADNAVMNSLIFRAAHDRKVGHVVFFSCSVMLPSSEQALTESDFDANAEIAPRYFGIGWTKVYIEKMCEFYARLGTTRYTAIRHSNIYGPHDKFDLERSHVFGATVTKAHDRNRRSRRGVGLRRRGARSASRRRSGRLRGRRHRPPGSVRSRSTIAAPDRRSRSRTLARMIVAASGRDLRIEHDLTKPTITNALALDCRKAADTSSAGDRRSNWTTASAAPSRGGATIWPLCRLVMLRKTRRSALTSRSSRHTTVISSVS